jgi:hypothetical protein
LIVITYFLFINILPRTLLKPIAIFVFFVCQSNSPNNLHKINTYLVFISTLKICGSFISRFNKSRYARNANLNWFTIEKLTYVYLSTTCSNPSVFLLVDYYYFIFTTTYDIVKGSTIMMRLQSAVKIPVKKMTLIVIGCLCHRPIKTTKHTAGPKSIASNQINFVKFSDPTWHKIDTLPQPPRVSHQHNLNLSPYQIQTFRQI